MNCTRVWWKKKKDEGGYAFVTEVTKAKVTVFSTFAAITAALRRLAGRRTRNRRTPPPRITSNQQPIGSIITVNQRGFFFLCSIPHSSGRFNVGNPIPGLPEGP